MKNVSVKKGTINKLVEECSENFDGNEMVYNKTLDVIPLNVFLKKVCNSCMQYIVLFVVFLITNMCICCVFLLVFKKR